MINIVSSSRYKLSRQTIRKTASVILANLGYDDSHVLNVVFVGKNKMRAIAKKYKKENEALPVLSFDYEKEERTIEQEKLLGEIFICYPQAVLLASTREKKVDHIINYLIEHGIKNILKN